MSRLFNKYVGVCSVLLLLFVSCTKEGLIGPEGEPGPAGPDGTDGGGGGGASAYMLSYNTPAGTTFAWEATTGGNYRLKYSAATHSGYTISLPDSVSKYIDEGALLIYADKGQDGDHIWQQVDHTPIEYYALMSYQYTIEKVTGAGYRFSFLSIGQPRSKFSQLRFVVIPKTASGIIKED